MPAEVAHEAVDMARVRKDLGRMDKKSVWARALLDGLSIEAHSGLAAQAATEAK